MPLAPGRRLGAYEIVAPLGKGGMGEVYRALDTRLQRTVAIKTLPDVFATDPDRRARFEREAQLLAALNHPSIAAIFGIEQAEGLAFLVLEFVDGQPLSELLSAGPVPRAEALALARQIADALAAAHERGIIHRDLKPANVMIAPDGQVKLLDFGLGKAIDASPSGASDAANSPTMTLAGTQAGVILGTAGYMSPEQAKGRAADRRSDVWAFGCVLFEMLTGRRAFDGEDVTEILAAIVRGEPDWRALPRELPPAVRLLVERCLTRTRAERLTDMSVVRFLLSGEAAAFSPAGVAAEPRRGRWWARLWPAVAGVLVTAGVAAWLWPGSSAPPAGLMRLSILSPPGLALFPDSTEVALSPDGTMVAFIVGGVTASQTQLWVRSLRTMTSRRLDGGDGAGEPFWSPDSQRIGFFTQDKLETLAESGGRPDVICDVVNGRGAVWTRSNVILFAPDTGGPLEQVPAAGGTPVPATVLGPKEYSHRFPTLLPDGVHFLYAVLPSKDGLFPIYAGSLADRSRTYVGSLESAPVYAPPGDLLYTREGGLVARPFDAATLAFTGDPAPLDDAPSMVLDPDHSFTAGRPVSLSNTGALAYFSAPSFDTTAEWMDATGRVTGTLDVPAGHYESLSVSPAGTHAVFDRSVSPAESSLWLVDLVRGGASRLSTGRGRNDRPVWSPDGTKIVFAADRDGPENVYVKTTTDASPERPLYTSDVPFKGPSAWSPDGREIVLDQIIVGERTDIFVLPAAGGQPSPVIAGAPQERDGTVSPDGRWLAYLSDETGRFQLYVQSFPGPGRKQQVSVASAIEAWWARDGRSLVFMDNGKSTLWSVEVEPGPTLVLSTPKLLATLPPNTIAVGAMPDLRKFIVLVPERAGPGSETVVLNWRAGMGAGRH